MVEVIETALGRYTFTNPEDYIAVHLRQYGQWEIHLCKCLLDVLPGAQLRGADVGANVGLFSVQMVLLGRATGKDVVLDAFEVQPRVYANLLDNLALNAMTGVITPRNVAIGATDGTVELEDVDLLAQRNTGEFSLRSDVRQHFGIDMPDAAKIEVPMKPLEEGYDFIKIDVEGMELEIIRGAEPMLRRTQPAIIVEAWGAEKAPWFQSEAAELLDLLRDIYPNELPMGENTLFWAH